MIWALSDPLRFAAEQKAVAALGAASPWLVTANWIVTDGGIAVDFDIDLGDCLFDGRLTYPATFPLVPPVVAPRAERRWSQHQYGAGGELCLEWGPDNWLPDVTGADMIASAHRLVMGEAGGAITPVPSRHELTVGQEMRSEARRFVATAPLVERLAGLAGDQDATFGFRVRGSSWLVVLCTLDGEGEWADASIPEAVIKRGSKMSGRVVLVDAKPTGLGGSASELRTRLLGASAPADLDFEVLLCRGPGNEIWAAILSHSTDLAIELAVVPPDPRRRLDDEHATLGAASVGLVGCGSLGSKIATSLARSGVRRFTIVDDDVLRPGNLVRHDLDWHSVGRHKADALADRLRAIDASVTVTTRRHRLGGQESNMALDGAVSQLALCDLVVDATADGRAFNYAAAAVAEGRHPMIWVEVFGGGFGGLVARSRPGLDPGPQTARSRIEAWCRELGTEPPVADRDYGASDGEATMVADDAAVSVLAAHATGMALDILIGHSPSRYPTSAYMIGLADSWIFSQPFDTRPIDLGTPESTTAVPDYQDPAVKRALASLGELVAR